MKTMLIFFASLLVSSAYAKSFDPSAKLYCATAVGNYDEIQKFAIESMDNYKKRDITIYPESRLLVDVCIQEADIITCSWSESKNIFTEINYLVSLDLGKVRESDSSNTYIVSGEVKKTGSPEHKIICRQNI